MRGPRIRPARLARFRAAQGRPSEVAGASDPQKQQNLCPAPHFTLPPQGGGAGCGRACAFAPRLPEVGAAAASAEEVTAAILQVSAACYAIQWLLWCTEKVATAAPGALAPDTVFRLAACASFVAGPGLAAAALAHQLVAGRLWGTERTEAAPVRPAAQLLATPSRPAKRAGRLQGRRCAARHGGPAGPADEPVQRLRTYPGVVRGCLG